MDDERTCYACGEDIDSCAPACCCINCEIDREMRSPTPTPIGD